MKFWATLKDSFYETIDFKFFYVLLVLSVVLTVICFSFTFPRLPVEKVLTENLKPAAQVDGNVEVVEESRLTPAARYRFALKPANPERFDTAMQQKIVQHRQAREMLQRAMQPPEDRPNQDWLSLLGKFKSAEAPKSDDEWSSRVQDYLQSISGIEEAAVLQLDRENAGPPRQVEVEVAVNWAKLRHAHQVGFVFGIWKENLGEQPLGMVLFFVQTVLISAIAGWAGIIIALIVTAGFVPNMLRKGTVDLLLVKRISRPVLLVYKYVGGLAFVFFNAVVLVTGTWIAFGVNTGNWSPWYLVSIAVLTFFFAILYSISVLVGVLTRSQLAAILLSIGLWFGLFLVHQVYGFIHNPEREVRIPQAVRSTVDAVHFVLPKPSDLAALNSFLLMRANGSEEFVPVQRKLMEKFSWTETISTSAAFIVVMLGLASWRFSRSDY